RCLLNSSVRACTGFLIAIGVVADIGPWLDATPKDAAHAPAFRPLPVRDPFPRVLRTLPAGPGAGAAAPAGSQAGRVGRGPRPRERRRRGPRPSPGRGPAARAGPPPRGGAPRGAGGRGGPAPPRPPAPKETPPLAKADALSPPPLPGTASSATAPPLAIEPPR